MQKRIVKNGQFSKKKNPAPKFRMKKKSAARIALDRYHKTMLYICNEDSYATNVMIATTKSLIEKAKGLTLPI
jgi:hypothetical protein